MKKLLLAVFMAAFFIAKIPVKASETDVYYEEIQRQFLEQYYEQFNEQYEEQLKEISETAEEEPISNYEVEVTEYERGLLERVAMNEAGNQGIQGMRYIVCVVLNRVESSSADFEDSIEGVIFHPSQFTTKIPSYISEDCKRAVDEELKSRSDYHILWFSRGWPEYGTRQFEYKDHKFSGY